jgi:predicted N-acyltransferase
VRYLSQALIRRWPLLVCQAPLASASGLILPESPLRTAALKTIAQVALEQAQSAHAFLAFDYLERQQALEPDWPEAFVLLSLPDPGTSINITWPDFDSYLGHLSYKTRKNYRRNCRAADRLGIKITYHPTVTALEDALVLIRNVERQHHEPPNPWARRVLENAPLVDSVWLAAEIDDRLVGCELLLGDSDFWFVTALGLDYSVQYVYFQLGYADIRYAIEHGARQLRWGSGAYETKQRLGFQLEDNSHVAFAASNQVLRWMGRWLATS